MKATTTLPETYAASGAIDLSKNRRLALVLNLAAVLLFFLFGWAFVRVTIAIRPDMGNLYWEVTGWFSLVAFIVVLVGLMAGQVILHELIHGLFFWLFTGDRAHYGFKGLYAYAAAPDWYLPRNQHLVTTLAPFILITMAGLILLFFIPAGLIPALLLIVVANAAGAVGDLIVSVWLALQPSTTLVRDSGDAITAYHAAGTKS